MLRTILPLSARRNPGICPSPPSWQGVPDMRRDIEDRAGEGARRTAWLGVALLLCALVAAPSCATFPAAHPFPSLVGSGESLVQEGELTVGDGAEAAVTYRRPFQSPPRVTIVEFRQSWSK